MARGQYAPSSSSARSNRRRVSAIACSGFDVRAHSKNSAHQKTGSGRWKSTIPVARVGAFAAAQLTLVPKSASPTYQLVSMSACSRLRALLHLTWVDAHGLHDRRVAAAPRIRDRRTIIAALAVFAFEDRARQRADFNEPSPRVCAVWFAAFLGPTARRTTSRYYLAIPSIGICWLIADARRF